MVARGGVVVGKFAFPVRAATIAWALLSKSFSDNFEKPVLSLFMLLTTTRSGGRRSRKSCDQLHFSFVADAQSIWITAQSIWIVTRLVFLVIWIARRFIRIFLQSIPTFLQSIRINIRSIWIFLRL